LQTMRNVIASCHLAKSKSPTQCYLLRIIQPLCTKIERMCSCQLRLDESSLSREWQSSKRRSEPISHMRSAARFVAIGDLVKDIE
jgi:hypothetical protein